MSDPLSKEGQMSDVNGVSASDEADDAPARCHCGEYLMADGMCPADMRGDCDA